MSPSRNAQCPCGSGKKYKRCCGSAESAHPVPQPESNKELIQSALQTYRSGHQRKAVELLDSVLRSTPKDPDALWLLGTIARESGDLDRATGCFERLVRLFPGIVKFHAEYIATLSAMNDVRGAIQAARDAIRIHPAESELRYNLGLELQNAGMLEPAAEAYTEAISINPKFVLAYNNLGNTLRDQGKFDESVSALKSAVQLAPDLAIAHNNLGTVYNATGYFDEARKCFERALDLNPEYANAYTNLANLLKDEGMTEEAIKAYDRALVLAPNVAAIQSNRLYALNFTEMVTPEQSLKEHMKFGRTFVPELKKNGRRTADANKKQRKLKIGYLSPDFRDHAVASFIKPVFSHHDHSRFEIYAYYNNSITDSTTEELRGCADAWRDIAGVSDDHVADQIRKDKIDILVDLAGHTAGNRLLVFAKKPAPVQVTWIGYPNTTGLSTMDYRFTDANADPVGTTEKYHVEELVRLPKSFLVYTPPGDAPDVVRAPVFESGRITFGSFNNIAKVTPGVMDVWADILNAVPGSHLMMKYNGLDQATLRKRVVDIFASKGISSDRLELCGKDLKRSEHLARYADIDIALDTFPYNGTTTSCEALWMGVPVICLEGQTHSGRVGVSILRSLGLEQLIGKTRNEYVGIAVQRASDMDVLNGLRMGMRDRMLSSPLLDAAQFTRDLEAACLGVWSKTIL